MKTLYIGETDSRDSKLYYELDESAFNLTVGNHKQGLEQKRSGVFYTSVTNFQNQLNIMLQVCWRFDKIICRPPATWSVDETYTEQFLKLLSLFKPIENFVIDSTRRKTEQPQIWVAGCSWSSAVGVAKEQRWGSLLADQMNMAVTVLAEGGSGNSYQARKLLSADIRENDVVIFQVTTPHRETIFGQDGVEYGMEHVNVQTFKDNPDLYKTYSPNRLDELTLVINQIKDMQNLINFSQKLKAKLLIWHPGIPLWIGEYSKNFLRDKENFYSYKNKMSDFGTDGLHPGPKTHKQYADFVFEKFKQQEEQT